MTRLSAAYALCDDIATAVATALTEEGGAAPKYAVTVVSDARANREKLSALEVRIMPAAAKSENPYRDSDARVLTVHVVAVGPCDPADTDGVDESLALAERLESLWATDADGDGPLRNENFDGWSYRPPVIRSPIFDQDLLHNFKLAACPVAVTYWSQP